jgi:hypothetical protein
VHVQGLSGLNRVAAAPSAVTTGRERSRRRVLDNLEQRAALNCRDDSVLCGRAMYTMPSESPQTAEGSRMAQAVRTVSNSRMAQAVRTVCTESGTCMRSIELRRVSSMGWSGRVE